MEHDDYHTDRNPEQRGQSAQMIAVLVQRNDVMLVRRRLDHLFDVNGMAEFFNVLAIGGDVEDGR